MSDEPTEILKAVREIRDLVLLMAEPAIAERDRKLRSELVRIVGASDRKRQATLLMDGSRSQADIQRETQINQGDLSTLVKRLTDGNLLSGDLKKPALAIPIQRTFFDDKPKTNSKRILPKNP